MKSCLGSRSPNVVSILFCVQLFVCGCGVDRVRIYEVPRARVQSSLKRIQQNSIDPKPESMVPDQVLEPGERKLTWTLPDDWKQNLGSGMKLADISPVNDSEVKISIVALSGNGGGLLSNLNRWRGQLGIQPVTTKELESDQIDFFFCSVGQVRLFKLFADSSEGQGFLIGVISLKSQTIFVKLSGPSERLVDYKDKMTSMLKSFRRVK